MNGKSIAIVLVAVSAPSLLAEGHGPAFGLATPTLGQGQWSSDTMGMSLGAQNGTTFMFREMIGYGINEDLQAILTFPLSPIINKSVGMPNHRMGVMGGSFTGVEGSLLWRFQRQAPRVGTRYESSFLIGGAIPTEDRRGMLENTPSVHVAAVTGYASRTVYGWIGGGYQRHFSEDGDRVGDLPYATAVFGWRPPLFREDYPKPDWRLFIESVAEFPQRDRMAGDRHPNSGGEKVLLGPSVLGLYGRWGVEAGALFPVHQRLNGSQPDEKFRAKLVLSYWF